MQFANLPMCGYRYDEMPINLPLERRHGLRHCPTAMMAPVRIRPALPAEIPALERLIAASARDLSQGYYTPAQIEAAITHVFGVDSELVADGSYLVASDSDDIIGCGGWSRRATLFGGDRFAGRASGLLDPARDAAKIRAFFVAPQAARRGVGAALLDACESAAIAAGFARTELMATMPGVPFYSVRGYVPGEAISLDCGGVAVPFLAMHKQLSPSRVAG